MASAGTGKTWLLVTRLVRLLLQNVPPNAILAITFTRKAAAEMHSRLNERLLLLATVDEQRLEDELRHMGLEPTPRLKTHARHLYEELAHAPHPPRTTTFHAFCQEILRRFPLEADVPPGFELTEKTGELRKMAKEALIDEATTAPDSPLAQDLEQLLEYCNGQYNLGTALDSLIDHRSDWWSFTAGSAQPADFAASRLRQCMGIDEGEDPYRKLLNTPALQEIEEFCALLLRHPTDSNVRTAERLTIAMDDTAPVSVRFAALEAAFLTQKGEPRKRNPSKTQAGKMGNEGEARFLELHNHSCHRLIEVRGLLAAQQTLRVNGAWFRVGHRLLEIFQRLKDEQRLLDFNDLEWRAFQLLTQGHHAHWVQYKLDQRIEHLLVDEFQDTNPTQWRLLLPLLQEMAAGDTARQRSVFLVGDAKQSIYRFRRADPRLFHTAHHWLAQHLGAHAHPLHTSWRSAPAVLEAVNRMFDSSGPLHGVLDDFVPHATHHPLLWGRVELLPLVEHTPAEPDAATGLRNPLQAPRVDSGDETHLKEGRLIAGRIAALINDRILLGPADRARPIHYGDILLLIRSRTHVAAYEQALRETGIPYVGADRGTLLQSLEVDDMIKLLETLITPHNNLALAQILRAPLFACSNADLARLAECREGTTWFERLNTVAALNDEEPLHRAARWLGKWHGVAGHIPIHDLLDRIYSEGNVIARYEAAFAPHLRSRVRANLLRFLELALEIDHGRYPSLTRFLSRLGELREQGEAPDEAPAAAGSERVRLMTIHAAKGLEAPVVFLADSASTAAGGDKPYHALVEWPTGSPHPEYLLLTGNKQQIDPFTAKRLAAEKHAQERESANLLYVALTRAKQLLFISGTQPARGDGLGWYGHLQQAISDGTLTNGQMPMHDTSHAIATPPRATPSRQLRQVITTPRIVREIAPSMTTATDLPALQGDEDGRLRGIMIHRMLEYVTGQVGNIPLSIPETLAAEFDRPLDDPELRSCWAETQTVVANPALAMLFGPATHPHAWNEVPLQYQENGCLVYGLVDRLVWTEQEILLVDYKTHRTAHGRDTAQIASHYRQQMRYYTEGVQRLWPEHLIRPMLLFTATATLHHMVL